MDLWLVLDSQGVAEYTRRVRLLAEQGSDYTDDMYQTAKGSRKKPAKEQYGFDPTFSKKFLIASKIRASSAHPSGSREPGEEPVAGAEREQIMGV